MVSFARAPVTAVLGPTNTGKTHLAVERMCGHSSGMMGFPLRLLAREVYDRVVAIKGENLVALVTGEEKIIPPGARYFLCTAESMPISGSREAGAKEDFAFVALDEAQLGADPERGHIFTDRLLRARGREETMILGSASISRIVKALIPDVDIISRPRFSTLSYAGAKKLSRLPRRSAIVAFSAEEVYAVAEMLRRFRGGAAVVMGALSPRTRNAQVQMFLNGDVDYLVATDAIGMGLNLDVNHVAFAGLTKFDGVRMRRLFPAEMAQIAGRAGRHQRDGTFGTVAVKVKEPVFESQTKNKLGNTDVRGWIANAVKAGVVDFLHKNREAAQKLESRILHNEKLRKELNAVKKEAKEAARRISIKNPNLRDCKYHFGHKKHGDDSTVFLTEGQSAAGSIVSSRDPNTQAIFTLKGKPQNMFGRKMADMYKNEELFNMMMALGIEDGIAFDIGGIAQH